MLLWMGRSQCQKIMHLRMHCWSCIIRCDMQITLPGRTTLGSDGQTTGRTTLGSSKRSTSTSMPTTLCIQFGCILTIWILLSWEHSSILQSFVMKKAGSISLVVPGSGNALVMKPLIGTWVKKMTHSFLIAWMLCEWYMQRKCLMCSMSWTIVYTSWWCIRVSSRHTSSLSWGWGENR